MACACVLMCCVLLMSVHAHMGSHKCDTLKVQERLDAESQAHAYVHEHARAPAHAQTKMEDLAAVTAKSVSASLANAMKSLGQMVSRRDRRCKERRGEHLSGRNSHQYKTVSSAHTVPNDIRATAQITHTCRVCIVQLRPQDPHDRQKLTLILTLTPNTIT